MRKFVEDFIVGFICFRIEFVRQIKNDIFGCFITTMKSRLGGSNKKLLHRNAVKGL